MYVTLFSAIRYFFSIELATSIAGTRFFVVYCCALVLCGVSACLCLRRGADRVQRIRKFLAVAGSTARQQLQQPVLACMCNLNPHPIEDQIAAASAFYTIHFFLYMYFTCLSMLNMERTCRLECCVKSGRSLAGEPQQGLLIRRGDKALFMISELMVFCCVRTFQDCDHERGRSQRFFGVAW
jgi:hypothetical protein